MTRFSHPPTVFGVGRWPRGRIDVTGVRRWHGDPPQTSFLGARPHGAPCSYLGNQGDINHFSQHFSQPLFTHPQDRCRKGHKDPIPRWLCFGSCTQGNFEGLVSTSLPPTHSLTHCELLPTPVSAERASSCPENGHTPFLLPTLSGLPPAALPGAGCPLPPLRPVPLDGDAPKVSSRPSFDIGLCGHACTRTYEFLGPCRPPAPSSCLFGVSTLDSQRHQESTWDFPGQWLRLCTPNAGHVGSIPGWGTKIPRASWHCQKMINMARTHLRWSPPNWVLFHVPLLYFSMSCLSKQTCAHLTLHIQTPHIQCFPPVGGPLLSISTPAILILGDSSYLLEGTLPLASVFPQQPKSLLC